MSQLDTTSLAEKLRSLNPFGGGDINKMGSMTDLQTQQMSALEQLQLAQELRKQAATPIKSDRMVHTGGGQWAAPDQIVPVGIGEGLAQLGKGWLAGQQEDAARKDMLDLAQKDKEQQIKYGTEFNDAYNGIDMSKQETPTENPDGSISYGETQTGGPNAGLAYLLKNPDAVRSPILKEILPHLAKGMFPDKETMAGNKPYYQFLSTPEGYMAGDTRTGNITPRLNAQGLPIVKDTASPDLQGSIANKRAEAEASHKLTTDEQGVLQTVEQAVQKTGQQPQPAQPLPAQQPAHVGEDNPAFIGDPQGMVNDIWNDPKLTTYMKVGLLKQLQAKLESGGIPATQVGLPKQTGIKIPTPAEVSADKEFAGTVGKQTAEDTQKHYEAATTAVNNLNKLDETLHDLQANKGTTGAFAEMTNDINRFKTFLTGSKAAGKQVADTEYLKAALGSDVFPLIQSLGIGARGMDTPAERDFLLGVMTGQIEMNRGTLIRMTQTRKNIAERVIKKWNDKVNSGQVDNFFKFAQKPKELLQRDQTKYFEVKDPNGDAHMFSTQKEADAFRKLIGEK